MHACSMHACINVYIFPSTEFNFPSTMCLLSTIYTRVYPPALVWIVTRRLFGLSRNGSNFPNTEICLFFTDFIFPYLFKRLSIHPHWLEWSQFHFWTFWTTGQISPISFFHFSPLQRCYFFLLLSIHQHWFEWSQDDFFECRKKGSNFRIADFFSPFASMFSTLWIVVRLYPFAVDLNDWE